MTIIVADRVKETSLTSGTGPLTLDGAVLGFIRFSEILGITVGDQVHYCAQEVDSLGNPTGLWEIGIGTYSAANTLTRTTVETSSNSNAAVNFGTGVKQVMLSMVASNAAITDKARVYTAGQVVHPVALTSASTVTINSLTSNSFTLTLTGNVILANPTFMVDGWAFSLKLKQDATGSRLMTFGSKFKFAGGLTPSLSAGANAIDLLGGYYDSTDDVILANLLKGFA